MTQLIQKEFNLAPGIRQTTEGVIFHHDLTFDQWLEYGRFLGTIEDLLDYRKADWLNFGRATFGDSEMAKGLRRLKEEADSGQTRFDVDGFRRADVLNRLAERTTELEPAHHYILAKAKLDATGQKMWMEMALKSKLSPNELQESIRVGHVLKLPPGQKGRAAGVSSFQGLSLSWSLLRRQIGEMWREWDEGEVNEALEFLRPIEEFCDQLRTEKLKSDG
jgi:hypothetical protein